jgi:putative ATP-dependent endonuclease of OLD family
MRGPLPISTKRGTCSLERPDLDLSLKKGLNVLIGENDSGKSAIIDAIRLVLGTHSIEYMRASEEDFYKNTVRFRIELVFEDLADEEAKYFPEWLGWAVEGGTSKTNLRVNLDVKRNSERIFPSEVRAGGDVEGQPLPAEARDYLKTTYLKPMRDAKAELVPKRNSRLAQIFQGHEAFKGKEENHHLKRLFDGLNTAIESYFDGKDEFGKPLAKDLLGKELKKEIDRYMTSFRGQATESEINAAEGSLKSILEKLELSIRDEINPGLGTLNRLFMATELVHLKKKNWHGLRLGLIEELEAHLHPQAQMQVIESLEKETGIQIILTTHSPNLASKAKLEDLIIFNGGMVFPMREAYTELTAPDRTFLEWFLDVTKSNLFFAKGVIMVEGWAEQILLPALAARMKSAHMIAKDLTEAGVTIVNVGSTAFLRYSKIFWRTREPEMNVPVAIVTDVDVPAFEKTPKLNDIGKPEQDASGKTVYDYLPRATTKEESAQAICDLEKQFTKQKVKAFVAPMWTLEYCLFKTAALSSLFEAALKQTHPRIDAGNAERELARKLIDGTLNKTEIAHMLAQSLQNDSMKIELASEPEDSPIRYLLDAIKYASGC